MAVRKARLVGKYPDPSYWVVLCRIQKLSRPFGGEYISSISEICH